MFRLIWRKRITELLKELYQLDINDKKTYDKLCSVGWCFV